MTSRKFYEAVQLHEKLRWIGVKDGEVYVDSDGTTRATAVKSILENPWETLEGVLTGKISPYRIKHVSRIVGYFSAHRNWNVSKLREQEDRRVGNYDIDVEEVHKL